MLFPMIGIILLLASALAGRAAADNGARLVRAMRVYAAPLDELGPLVAFTAKPRRTVIHASLRSEPYLRAR
jgi:hypothetical protein